MHVLVRSLMMVFLKELQYTHQKASCCCMCEWKKYEFVTFSVCTTVHNARRNNVVAAKDFHHCSWRCVDSQLPGKARKLSVIIYLRELRNMFLVHKLPSVLWRCWLGIRKSIQPVKKWVMSCWHGYLPGSRYKWCVYGPADATATPSSLASLKSRLV